MVSIKEINVRTRKDVQGTDIVFSNSYACTFIMKPGMTIHELLIQINNFKERVIEVLAGEEQREYDQGLFSEFMQLSSRKASDKVIRLTSDRMVEITKLIPDKFHPLPPDLRMGDAVQLRGGIY